MWDWLASQLDTTDIVVLTVILAVAVYFLVNSKSDKSRGRGSTTSNGSLPSSPVTTTATAAGSKSFIDRMKNENRQVLIVYGSQTGTAEELSGRLAKDLSRYSKKALVIDPEEVEVDDLSRLPEVCGCLLVLCVATYGEGDPTDNAQQMYEYLTTSDLSLNGVYFAVFGLGNKTYEHFNAVGKNLDARLEELGAERIYQIGLGDDDANLEEDFMRWREAFLSAVADRFGWEVNSDAETQRQYRLEMVDTTTPTMPTLFKGEYGRLGAFEKQRPPFDQKNPFLATIKENMELHAEKSDRSCRHIEFQVSSEYLSSPLSLSPRPLSFPLNLSLSLSLSLADSRIRYEAGDHLAVFPTNDPEKVALVLSRLDCDADAAFRLINTDEESSKRNPFPCPTTFRTALTHYVDIAAPLKSHVIKAISEYCSDEAEKAFLQQLSTTSEEGLKQYASFIVKERRSIVDVLVHCGSCRPPADYLLELLPRLQARYYSISSSPKHADDVISITAVVTKYSIGDRLIKGVCTNFLLDQPAASRVPVFVRKSQMRLPHRSTTQVIMIGPGTGLAPFRGFIQEREAHKKQGKEVGAMHLFFGCRNPDVDYIYKEELERYEADGLIQLHTAFSRLGAEKVYVQDKLWEHREVIHAAIEAGAHIYVCGDARNMARDVQAKLCQMFVSCGGLTEEEASKHLKDLEKQRRYQADVWS